MFGPVPSLSNDASSPASRQRAQGVVAVLGPTNTGKTHLAIERMLAHGSGIIGLPLRLLAREVYQRIVERVGADKVALVTGEEKIKPPFPRYWVATVEAMPRDIEVDFVAIDEVQLAADMDRGHVFTDRLLNRRGRHETLIIGAATMRPIVETLLPGASIVSRPRLSQLTFAGERKLTRLPRRSAIVAFSAEEVYAIAELIRRQKGGAAVVMGALSPRTRNAQVELYQNGDVDYLVATDAIGMGLNLDVDHVAFAADRKFDGHQFRLLNAAEIGQIAGRAGRHLKDGTFGTTGRCAPFDPEFAQQIEEHAFEPVRILQWRNNQLDFSSLAALQASLAKTPDEPGLTRAPMAQDEIALEIAGRDPEVRAATRGLTGVERLWQVAQIPDYRRLAPAAHAELVGTIFQFLARRGRIPDDWFTRQIAMVDRTDGDIDTLSARIAQVRTWTFVANRPDWLGEPEHWQRETRRVEDSLSDALHERLAQRFVDRRTSVLMRRLRENAMLEAEITATGDVLVEGQHVGTLHGFQFAADASGDSSEGKALRAAAAKALAGEIEQRADKLSAAPDESFVMSADGTIRWTGEAVAKLIPGDKVLEPRIRIIADEQLTGSSRDKVDARLTLWIENHVKKLLGPLLVLETPPDLAGVSRGIAYQIAEALGVLDRSKVAAEVKELDQPARAALRSHGVRFGAYHLYVPALLKPAPRALACQLWALKHGGPETKGLDELPHLAASGRTSIPVDPEVAKDLYRAAGFRVCGSRAIRVDILERLADLIRPAIAYRPGVTPGEPPAGTADQDGFVVTVAMTSLAGCSGEDFASILKSLGYVLDRRKGPAITRPLVAAAPRVPLVVAQATDAPAAEVPASDETPVPAADEPKAEPVQQGALPDAVAAQAEDGAGEESVAEPIADEPAATETASAEPVVLDEQVNSASPEALTGDEAAADRMVSEGAPADEPTPISPDTAPEDATVAIAEPAEPELIDVWRPHRQSHHHQGPRPARHGRRDQPSQRRDGAVQTAEGAAPGDRPRHGDRLRSGDRPDRRADGPHPDGARPDGRPRFDKPRGPRPDGERSGPPRGKGPDRGRHEDRKGPRGDDRGGRAFEQRAPRPERQPDPDSPFAKLLALKAQLQSKGDGKDDPKA